MSTCKLVYFNGRGRAETIRLAFAESGIKFEDYRIADMQEWTEMKPKTFSQRTPYLEVDGRVIIESMSIARYVARQGGLMGKDSLEQAVIESLTDICSETLDKFIAAKFHTEDTKKEEALKEFAEKHLPQATALLVKYLGDKKFLTGNKITLADLHFYSVFESIKSHQWDKLQPSLKLLYDRVAASPRIAEYLKTRPETEF